MSQISSPGDAMSLRDHFAAAALTGLLAQGDDGSFSEESYVRAAYRWADAMLRERGNQSEPLNSSPVTEPMPKEKRAEVSARIDGVDHPVPYSRTDEKRVNWPTIRGTTQPRNGTPAEGSVQGDGTEPAAWAVTMGDGSVYEAFAAHQRDEAVELATKCLFGSDRPLPLAPLYRQPQPMLTDEEREAIERLEDRCAKTHCVDTARALRGLLERTT